MRNFTFGKQFFAILSFLFFCANTTFGQSCPAGQVRYTDHVYAINFSSNNNVVNPVNSTGASDNTYATFSNTNDRLVLEMVSNIASGTSVIINGVNGGNVNLEVRLGTNGPWTPIGTGSTSIGTAFNSPITWKYIRITKGTGTTGNVFVDAVDASVLTNTCVLDTDGDGVQDSFDLDDDNDGILDSVECLGCSIKFANGGFESPVIAANSYSVMSQALVPGWKTTATDG